MQTFRVQRVRPARVAKLSSETLDGYGGRLLVSWTERCSNAQFLNIFIVKTTKDMAKHAINELFPVTKGTGWLGEGGIKILFPDVYKLLLTKNSVPNVVSICCLGIYLSMPKFRCASSL